MVNGDVNGGQLTMFIHLKNLSWNSLKECLLMSSSLKFISAAKSIRSHKWVNSSSASPAHHHHHQYYDHDPDDVDQDEKENFAFIHKLDVLDVCKLFWESEN